MNARRVARVVLVALPLVGCALGISRIDYDPTLPNSNADAGNGDAGADANTGRDTDASSMLPHVKCGDLLCPDHQGCCVYDGNTRACGDLSRCPSTRDNVPLRGQIECHTTADCRILVTEEWPFCCHHWSADAGTYASSSCELPGNCNNTAHPMDYWACDPLTDDSCPKADYPTCQVANSPVTFGTCQ
jgi:hypothetical protein